MSVIDAEPGDIYADANGKLWRILSVYREPTVEAEEVEGTLNDPNVPPLAYAGGQTGMQALNVMCRATIDKRVQRAFTSADVWFGWQRIFRRQKAAAEPATTE